MAAAVRFVTCSTVERRLHAQRRSLQHLDPELVKVVEQPSRLAEAERGHDEVHVGRRAQRSFIELAQPRGELIGRRAHGSASCVTASSRRAAFTRSFHVRVQ